MTAPGRNTLLDALPAADRGELFGAGREVDLEHGQALNARGRVARVYFPTSACLSLHEAASRTGPEVMMVGFEGALGGELALGPHAHPFAAVVQAEGRALGISASEFNRQVQRGGALQAVLLAYVDSMLQQIAISCGCLHDHTLAARVARRLLMTHDRARGGDFHVTHEFLAAVLGVRRVGVTNAATDLQRLGLISYRRGDVSVLDRHGLESAACSCYAASRRVDAHAARARRPV